MDQVSPLGLKERLDSDHPPRLLDVREPHEHAIVSLPEATLIPLGQLADRVGEIDAWKHEPLVVLCHHGIRSQHAIAFLSSMGFQHLENLQSGIDGYAALADPSLPRY